MQRITIITTIAVATVAAAAAVWFWALTPLGFASYLSSTGATDADIIRQYWPHRLVQPEWVNATPDRMMSWHRAEVRARLSVVAVLWLLTTGTAIYKFIRRRRVRPNHLGRSARTASAQSTLFVFAIAATQVRCSIAFVNTARPFLPPGPDQREYQIALHFRGLLTS